MATEIDVSMVSVPDKDYLFEPGMKGAPEMNQLAHTSHLDYFKVSRHQHAAEMEHRLTERFDKLSLFIVSDPDDQDAKAESDLGCADPI